ncbi:hypothetical protein HPB52_000166 [Rhipicephalus sanguineus]|uniref:Uncharacterized protein n=1 Tax=Rhipicephalus sanguineus TaxID=34632 RepID=A0A9D4PE32_RHISA|nr:hypothetical protein HPB52_000166 [Rhipicephalus sanguineus]
MRATDDDRLGPVQVDRKCDTCRSSNQRRRRPRNDAQNKPQHPSGRDEAPIRGNSALPCSAQTGQEDETQASRPRPSPPPVSSMKGKTTPPPSREKSGELCQGLRVRPPTSDVYFGMTFITTSRGGRTGVDGVDDVSSARITSRMRVFKLLPHPLVSSSSKG